MGVKLNYVIDVAMVFAFLTSFVTGIIKLPALYSFWGVNHRYMLTATTTVIHDQAGLAFGCLAMLHLLLHIKWYVAVTRSFLNKGGKKHAGDKPDRPVKGGQRGD